MCSKCFLLNMMYFAFNEFFSPNTSPLSKVTCSYSSTQHLPYADETHDYTHIFDLGTRIIQTNNENSSMPYLMEVCRTKSATPITSNSTVFSMQDCNSKFRLKSLRKTVLLYTNNTRVLKSMVCYEADLRITLLNKCKSATYQANQHQIQTKCDKNDNL